MARSTQSYMNDLQNVTLAVGINQHSLSPSGQVSIHGSQKIILNNLDSSIG